MPCVAYGSIASFRRAASYPFFRVDQMHSKSSMKRRVLYVLDLGHYIQVELLLYDNLYHLLGGVLRNVAKNSTCAMLIWFI